MKLTRKQALAGAAAGAIGASGIYELVDKLAGATPPRADATTFPPEQHLLDGIRVVNSDGIAVLVPPLHHEVITARVLAGRSDAKRAQGELEQLLAGLNKDYQPTPAGLGVTVAWGLPYFRRLVPDATARLMPHDRRAQKPVLFAAERFPSDPHDTKLEANDVAILLQSDVREHILDAEKRLHDSKIFQFTTIRRGFAGGGFDGKTSLPKQMAVAAQIPGSDLIPETAELFLGFTSTQKASMGPGAIANFETLGYVDFRGSDYFRHGTHMHLSHLREDVEAWYLNFDFDERVTTAFKPGLDVKQGTQTVPEGPRNVSSAADVRRGYRAAGRIGHSASIQPTSRLQRTLHRARRDGLCEGHGDPDPRRLQHARQPVRVGRARLRVQPDAERRPALRRLQPDRRRLPPQPDGDGRPPAGRNDPVGAARPPAGLQLDPLDDQPPELPRAAAAAPLVPARRRLAEERARDVVPVGRHGLQFRRRFVERTGDDVVTAECGHLAELPGIDEIGRLEPETGGKDPVAGGGGSAALDMAEHGDARLVAGTRLDLFPEPFADAALGEQLVAELVDLSLVVGAGQLAALAKSRRSRSSCPSHGGSGSR